MKIELLRRTESPVLAGGISSGYFWAAAGRVDCLSLSVWLCVRLPRVAAHVRNTVSERLILPARVAGSGSTQPVWCSYADDWVDRCVFHADWLRVYYGHSSSLALSPDKADDRISSVWADFPTVQNRTRVTHDVFMANIQPAAEYLCEYLRQIDETLSRTVMPSQTAVR